MQKLKSRKFLAALLGALLPILAGYLSGDMPMPDAVQASCAVLCSYIFGQGAVDAMAARSQGSGDAE